LGWLVIGDYGYMNNGAYIVAHKMDEVAAAERTDFVLNTGDSF